MAKIVIDFELMSQEISEVEKEDFKTYLEWALSVEMQQYFSVNGPQLEGPKFALVDAETVKVKFIEE